MRASESVNTHIFPFLWIHGEVHEALEKEIRAIYDCGIKMFCVESRPHPEFCKEQWWEDFAFILKTAKELGMQVWLLDDKHYPTGYANGAIECNSSLKQKFIRAFTVDFYGNGEECRFVTDYGQDDEFLTAFVYRRTDETDGIDVESGVEITDFRNNVLTLPRKFTGYCRLMIFSVTTNYSMRENYIDMLSSDSCEMMVKTVYEPHYKHFKEYFGETFVGFFSDEPSFCNGAAEQSLPRGFYETQVGQYGVVYPWRKDMLSLLNCEKRELAALWLNTGKEHCADFRIRYMDVITKLYQKNFSEKLGKWCEEHDVFYTGHIIEDAGNHCRLGTGAGHYFRSMTGQHLSGVDVVLHQIETDSGNRLRFYCGPTVLDDYDFFHFTLAKLGVSAAHLEEKKHNRAMCEIFGAYGWGETINQMKWLVDFMLVRGINYFVPHAFNPKIDDTDCPPYFYHGGENPIYSAFQELMKYTEKMSGELSLSYQIKVAVLYHAEAEWSGKTFSSMDKVCKSLTENQIDFEIVPSEWLDKTEAKILIVPFAEDWGRKVAERLKKYCGKIIYADKNGNVDISLLEKLGAIDYKLKRKSTDIRVLKRGEKYFVFNEGNEAETNVLLTGDGGMYAFTLQAGESYLFKPKKEKLVYDKIISKLSTKCKAWVKGADEREYTEIGDFDYTHDVCALQGYEEFAGKIRYVLDFEIKESVKGLALDFGNVVGGLKVWVNGKEYPEFFGVPYCLDISDSATLGKNELVAELSTTLVLKHKDALSKFCKISKYALPMAIILIKSL